MYKHDTKKHEEWLTVKDLMTELNISKTTAYALARKIPVLRIGGAIRINRHILEEYLTNNRNIQL